MESAKRGALNSAPWETSRTLNEAEDLQICRLKERVHLRPEYERRGGKLEENRTVHFVRETPVCCNVDKGFDAHLG